MSNARKGMATGRPDSTRTPQAKAQTKAKRQARTLKGWSPTVFDTAALEAELSAGVAR